MNGSDRNGAMPALGSDWGGLSPHLIAEFYAVKPLDTAEKRIWVRDADAPVVRAPITDANAEATLNWQSPFENMGPDQKLGTLTAMLQAGGFVPLLKALKDATGAGALFDEVISLAQNQQGRSSFTKLNSTQVFNGMPPVKITVTAHFRAWSDARREVQAPMNQLMRWALPQTLTEDAASVAVVRNGEFNPMQSIAPQPIAMSYAGMLFQPIVIETIPYPLSGPRDERGTLTHASMTMSLASLTALDRRDWSDVVARA